MTTRSVIQILQQRSFFSTVFAMSALMVLTGCQAVADSSRSEISGANVTTKTTSILQIPTAITPAVQAAVGDYASDGYDKRQQGYDWVGVMIQPYGVADIEVKVRARADIKQPSCNFDGKATLLGQDDAHGVIFQTIANDSVTFLQFKDGLLTIDSQDKYALNYFCSGGGTLAGAYQKLTGNLELS